MALVMGFKTIYWTPISGSYFLKGSILENRAYIESVIIIIMMIVGV